MKFRYLLLAVSLFFVGGSMAYSAAKGLDHDSSHPSWGHYEKREPVARPNGHHNDFKDPISALVKSQHYKRHVFLRLCRDDWDDDDYDHGGGGNSGGGTSQVPIPAAAWLFGPGLVGLLGIKRRKA